MMINDWVINNLKYLYYKISGRMALIVNLNKFKNMHGKTTIGYLNVMKTQINIHHLASSKRKILIVSCSIANR